MPTYLIHGFRWPRAGFTGIRVHAIVHDLEDCSVEYIQNTGSKQAILQSFRKAYPELMRELDESKTGRTLDFVEQYDPLDETSEAVVSQPHAFVADKVVELGGGSSSTARNTETVGSSPAAASKEKPVGSSMLSVDVEEVIAEGHGLTPRGLEALGELRDKIAAGEKIGWWVVYNGDPDRAYDSYSDSDSYDDEYDDDDEDLGENQLERLATPTQSSMSAAGDSSGTTTTTALLAEETQRQPTTAVQALPPPKSPAAHQQQDLHGPPIPPPKPQTTPNKTLPLRTNKPDPVIGPMRAIIPPPPTKDEQIVPAEPVKAREVAAKAGGFRKKFFGKKT